MTGFTWSSGAIASAFRRSAGRVDRAEAAAWWFELHNGKPMSVWATFRGDCLRLSAWGRLPRHDTPSWKVMTSNGRLPAGARFTLDAVTGSPALRVETHIDREFMDAGAISSACALMARAGSIMHDIDDDADEPLAHPADKTARATNQSRPSWIDAWTDAESPVTELGDGRWGVDVETRAGRTRVIVDHRAKGTQCLVNLMSAPAAAAPREAMARFLLCATDAVMFVRVATLRENADCVAAVCLETWLPAEPRPVDVDRGVYGLASVCDRFAPEARALADEWLAESYNNARHVNNGALGRPGPAWGAGTRTNPQRLLLGGRHAV